ncbi:hypothetical protein G9A89_007070 [Geosiphon pyriformis]|nr:hypothetical protein G9A89_007070 [Geosiphon pyriformis]
MENFRPPENPYGPPPASTMSTRSNSPSQRSNYSESQQESSRSGNVITRRSSRQWSRSSNEGSGNGTSVYGNSNPSNRSYGPSNSNNSAVNYGNSSGGSSYGSSRNRGTRNSSYDRHLRDNKDSWSQRQHQQDRQHRNYRDSGNHRDRHRDGYNSRQYNQKHYRSYHDNYNGHRQNRRTNERPPWHQSHTGHHSQNQNNEQPHPMAQHLSSQPLPPNHRLPSHQLHPSQSQTNFELQNHSHQQPAHSHQHPSQLNHRPAHHGHHQQHHYQPYPQHPWMTGPQSSATVAHAQNQSTHVLSGTLHNHQPPPPGTNIAPQLATGQPAQLGQHGLHPPHGPPVASQIPPQMNLYSEQQHHQQSVQFQGQHLSQISTWDQNSAAAYHHTQSSLYPPESYESFAPRYSYMSGIDPAYNYEQPMLEIPQLSVPTQPPQPPQPPQPQNSIGQSIQEQYNQLIATIDPSEPPVTSIEISESLPENQESTVQEMDIEKEPSTLQLGTLTPLNQKPTELYEKLVQVGEGTYGKVYKARNSETGAIVALKRIRMETEREGFPITALREIKILQDLDHEHVVKLLEIMVVKGSVYMVFEYMDHDLTGVLSNPQIKFEPQHIKCLMKQLLEGIGFLHSRGILHRDIKGSNILLNNCGQLKLADFGLARQFQPRRMHDYTNRVITLWYRPPELCLGSTVYGPEVDIWSAGCIMVELFTGKPLFQGTDEITQLEAIYQLLGSPSTHTWPAMAELPWYELIRFEKLWESKFEEVYGEILSPKALELICTLLSVNPTDRPTAMEALELPYFTAEEPEACLPENLPRIHGDWHEFESKQRKRVVE